MSNNPLSKLTKGLNAFIISPFSKCSGTFCTPKTIAKGMEIINTTSGAGIFFKKLIFNIGHPNTITKLINPINATSLCAKKWTNVSGINANSSNGSTIDFPSIVIGFTPAKI